MPWDWETFPEFLDLNVQKTVLLKTVLLNQRNSAVFNSTVFVPLARWFWETGSRPIVEGGTEDDSGSGRGCLGESRAI